MKIKNTKIHYDKCLELGLLRNIDTEKYVFFSWISLNGLISNIVLSNNKDQEFLDNLIEEYLEYMLYGIFKQEI